MVEGKKLGLTGRIFLGVATGLGLINGGCENMTESDAMSLGFRGYAVNAETPQTSICCE